MVWIVAETERDSKIIGEDRYQRRKSLIERSYDCREKSKVRAEGRIERSIKRVQKTLTGLCLKGVEFGFGFRLKIQKNLISNFYNSVSTWYSAEYLADYTKYSCCPSFGAISLTHTCFLSDPEYLDE